VNETMSTFLARQIRRVVSAGLVLAMAGCASAPLVEPPPPTASDAQIYAGLYPTYAEICAASQLGKKSGFGAEISSGIGGHAVLYLNGVCRRREVDYPVLAMCDEIGDHADGVGLSVNAHYRNAEWVATEGRSFFFNGDLKPGQPLTKDGYRRIQDEALAKGIYKAVTFHDEVYDDMAPGFTQATYQYEMSVATDYALTFGRNLYCARVPLDRAQMQIIVKYLNDQNAPYRAGEIFDWNLFEHNCAHLNHNALAAAGVWDEWETDRFFLISMFDFPVPKNEFVNLMRRTNDVPIDDPVALYRDRAARRLLLEHGRLPTEPGALADLGVIPRQNEVYDPDSRIIFYDEAITGSYDEHFREILSQPRYFRLRDNLAYFAGLYKKIEAGRRPVEDYLAGHHGWDADKQADFHRFYAAYFAYIDRESKTVAQDLAKLDAQTPPQTRAARPS
jgi:hypothetical protein